MGIVMAGVHSHLFLIAGFIELSIALNIVVIAYAFAVEAGVMTGTEHVDSEALVASARRAMNHDKRYFSGHFHTDSFNVTQRLIFLLSHTEITEITEILLLNKRGTVLDGEGAEDGAGNGDKVLGYLNDFVPIDFHFTQIKLFKKVTQKSRKSQKLCNFASKILYAMTDNEITYEIRGAIYDVYKTLGPGLLESIYQEALVFELE